MCLHSKPLAPPSLRDRSSNAPILLLEPAAHVWPMHSSFICKPLPCTLTCHLHTVAVLAAQEFHAMKTKARGCGSWRTVQPPALHQQKLGLLVTMQRRFCPAVCIQLRAFGLHCLHALPAQLCPRRSEVQLQLSVQHTLQRCAQIGRTVPKSAAVAPAGCIAPQPAC